MSDDCSICGLKKELCICESIAKESQKIIVKIEQRKFRKKYTIISGIDDKEIDMRDLTKKLKNSFACGGSAKDGKIELQGDHKNKVKKILMEAGFLPEKIEIQ